MVIIDDNELSITKYMEWADSDGVFGTKRLCWDCWCEQQEKELKEWKEIMKKKKAVGK